MLLAIGESGDTMNSVAHEYVDMPLSTSGWFPVFALRKPTSRTTGHNSMSNGTISYKSTVAENVSRI
jgi:hypothetical protein